MRCIGALFLFLLINAGSCLRAQPIEEYKQRLQKSDHDSLRFKYTFLISDWYFGLNPRLAQKIGLEALAYLESSNSPSLQVRALQNVANRYWEDGEYAKSIAYQKKSLRIAKSNGLFFWSGKAYHLIGLDHYYMANYDSALYYYQQAKNQFRLARDSAYLSKVENHIGLVYDQFGEFGLAIDHILRSIQMQENIPGFNVISFSLLAANGPSDSAFFKYRIRENNLNLAYEIGRKDSFNIAQTLRSIGRDYLNASEPDKAIPYFKRSAFYYQASDFEPFWEDLGEAYMVMNRFDSAVYYSDLYLANMLEHGLRNNIAAANLLVGQVAQAQDKFDKALPFFQRALDLHKDMGNRLRIAECNLTMARLFMRMGRYTDAEKLAYEGLQLATSIKSFPKQSEAHQLLATIYQQLGQPGKALASLTQFHEMNKKLSEGEAGLQMARLEFLYSLKDKERQVKDLQQENLLKENQIESHNLQIAIGIGLLLIIAMVGALYYSRYRYSKKLNYRLEISNREKESLLQEIHHRVKNNLQIISSLINLKIRQSISPDTDETLHQLNGRIYSMGLIHEKLYLNEEMQQIRLDEYVEGVTRQLIDSFGEKEHPISLKVNSTPVEIDADRALTCGLIVNELITNSVKYAFTKDQRNPEIVVRVQKSNGHVIFGVSDNGMTAKTASVAPKKSFGSRFVDQLVNSKLNGEWNVLIENGYHVSIKFSESESRKN